MDIPEFRLAGKVALVTGAGRGIGKGIAEVLAQAGADVAINSLTEKYVTPLAAELARSTGRRVVPLVADVTRPDDVSGAVARVIADLGRLDVLVNNLGDSIRSPLVPLPGASGATGVSDADLRFVRRRLISSRGSSAASDRKARTCSRPICHASGLSQRRPAPGRSALRAPVTYHPATGRSEGGGGRDDDRRARDRLQRPHP